jgi:hypothetical protein
MKSANAFSYAISGSYTEDQMSRYGDYINQSAAALQGLGGWLSDQANKTLQTFDKFLNSRAWEMGRRLLGNSDGDFVPRYEVGYLGSIEALQNAQGFMRDVIMAHPVLQQLYLDGEISGYGGEFSAWCTGVGQDNLFYRKMWDGALNLEQVDGVNQLRHTHFRDTIGGKYSFREKVDSHKTHAAITHHMASTLFDLTSEEGNKRKSHQDDPEAE